MLQACISPATFYLQLLKMFRFYQYITQVDKNQDGNNK